MSPGAHGVRRNGLGYIPDTPDDGRDWIFGVADPALPVGRSAAEPPPPLPNEPIEFRAHVEEILHQGVLNSCVVHAVYGAMRTRRSVLGYRDPLGARLFGQYLAEADIGMEGLNLGAQLRGCMRGVNHYGFLPERDYKYGYDVTRHATPPPPLAYHRAMAQRTKGGALLYRRIFDKGAERIARIVQALAQGMPVAFGTQISHEFVDGLGLSGVVSEPSGASIAGGHAMYIVGYDPKRDAFLGVNSWGPMWGDGGTVWLSASYLAWPQTQDVWVIAHPPAYYERKKR